MPKFDDLKSACDRVLLYARENDYSGYSKFDALNSPILKAMSLNSPSLRFLMSQLVVRSPVNLRKVFGVAKSKNPKGIALFALAYLNLHESENDAKYLQEAQYCLSWLVENCAKGYSGMSWGYNFDWQNSTWFFAPRFTPNCVVTSFCGEAFLKAYKLTQNKEYLNIAREAVEFILRALPVLYEGRGMKCIGYVPLPVDAMVINVGALSAGLMAKMFRITGERELKEEAHKLIRFVVDKKTDYGAWFYTHPPNKSRIRHDNYHTGYVIDGILNFCINCDEDEYMKDYFQGLDFYRDRLFLPDGAPKYMSDRTYPFDIHGAAQGIITFCKASYYRKEYLDVARTIAKWSIANMQSPEHSYFYYQKGKVLARSFTLMRWCNAWMARALSQLMATVKNMEVQGK